MAFDAHANFAYSTVLTAPSPATSGTSVVVQSGDGAKFPAAPFNMAIWPAGAQPLTSNAEIVRCTAKSTDTLTITRTQESTSARTVVVGDQIAAVLTSKSLTDIEAAIPAAVPPNYLAPTGALYETFPRQFVTGGSTSVLTGRLYLYGINLPAGLTIGHIAFLSSGAAGTPTHWWFGLYDSSRVQLALTADQTSTAWGATTVQSLAIATVASGAASSFTTTYSGMYYLGYMMTATTPTTLLGSNMSATPPALAPVLLGVSDTGQTTPPGFPHTATTITATATNAYGYVAA